MKPNTRLKINKFIKKYGKLIGIILITLIVIYSIDKIVKSISEVNTVPETSLTPNISVINSKKTPKKVQKTTEDFVEEFVNYCNEGEYEKAYNLLSEDCREYRFKTLEEFTLYIKNRFYAKRNYSIQSYSVYNKKYIYVLKLFDDIMATGLTNNNYKYKEEIIIAYYNDKNEIVFNFGEFIDREKISSVQENDYLKVDVESRIINYGNEIYYVRLTNRSNYTIVIQDGNVEDEEVLLNIGNENRANEISNPIVLKPRESKTISVYFNKFYDDGDESKSIILNNIRVMENYTGNAETASQEIENAVDKLSMELSF